MLRRNRIVYALLIALTLMVGLASRRVPDLFPVFLARYLGDTLWALLVFWLIGFVWPNIAGTQALVGALLFAYGIEVSQLWHPLWLETLRNTTLGALVLGHGFLWSDIVCYTVGIGAGYLAERPLGHYFS